MGPEAAARGDGGGRPLDAGSRFGEGKPVYELRETFASVKQAREAAAARLARLSRATAAVHGTILGRPDLIAAGGVRIRGAGEGFDGLWAVTRTVHSLDDARGYVCQFESESPTTV